MNMREELEALIVKWRQPWSQDREKEEMRLICAEDLETILAKPELRAFSKEDLDSEYERGFDEGMRACEESQ